MELARHQRLRGCGKSPKPSGWLPEWLVRLDQQPSTHAHPRNAGGLQPVAGGTLRPGEGDPVWLWLAARSTAIPMPASSLGCPLKGGIAKPVARSARFAEQSFHSNVLCDSLARFQEASDVRLGADRE